MVDTIFALYCSLCIGITVWISERTGRRLLSVLLPIYLFLNIFLSPVALLMWAVTVSAVFVLRWTVLVPICSRVYRKPAWAIDLWSMGIFIALGHLLLSYGFSEMGQSHAVRFFTMWDVLAFQILAWGIDHMRGSPEVTGSDLGDMSAEYYLSAERKPGFDRLLLTEILSALVITIPIIWITLGLGSLMSISVTAFKDIFWSYLEGQSHFGWGIYGITFITVFYVMKFASEHLSQKKLPFGILSAGAFVGVALLQPTAWLAVGLVTGVVYLLILPLSIFWPSMGLWHGRRMWIASMILFLMLLTQQLGDPDALSGISFTAHELVLILVLSTWLSASRQYFSAPMVLIGNGVVASVCILFVSYGGEALDTAFKTAGAQHVVDRNVVKGSWPQLIAEAYDTHSASDADQPGRQNILGTILNGDSRWDVQRFEQLCQKHSLNGTCIQSILWDDLTEVWGIPLPDASWLLIFPNHRNAVTLSASTQKGIHTIFAGVQAAIATQSQYLVLSSNHHSADIRDASPSTVIDIQTQRGGTHGYLDVQDIDFLNLERLRTQFPSLQLSAPRANRSNVLAISVQELTGQMQAVRRTLDTVSAAKAKLQQPTLLMADIIHKSLHYGRAQMDKQAAELECLTVLLNQTGSRVDKDDDSITVQHGPFIVRESLTWNTDSIVETWIMGQNDAEQFKDALPEGTRWILFEEDRLDVDWMEHLLFSDESGYAYPGSLVRYLPLPVGCLKPERTSVSIYRPYFYQGLHECPALAGIAFDALSDMLRQHPDAASDLRLTADNALVVDRVRLDSEVYAGGEK